MEIGNIITYRIFSLICISLLSILGYTHIRKDFGEKTGILFSFFSLFLPEMCIYANEIRMYSLAILLVTILSIYGYRIYKGDTSWKNWIIFELSSLGCMYVHYYGLMIAGLINLVLFLYFIECKRKQSLKRIIIFGICLFILYIPWGLYFISQLSGVSKGFWIGFKFPQTLMELLSYQFIGNINYYIGFVISILIYIYLIIKYNKMKKEKQDVIPAKIAFKFYFGIIIAALLITALLQTSILYYRYLFVVTGLYIFGISYILARDNNKKAVIIICGITLILGITSNIIMIKNNYSFKNYEPIKYVEDNIEKNDEIVYTNIGAGSIFDINFKNNKQFFYNEEDWGVQKAYKAFGPQMDTYIDSNFMKDLSGKIWIIDRETDYCYKTYFNNENYKFIEQKKFETKYHYNKFEPEDNQYIITLVEKTK